MVNSYHKDGAFKACTFPGSCVICAPLDRVSVGTIGRYVGRLSIAIQCIGRMSIPLLSFLLVYFLRLLRRLVHLYQFKGIQSSNLGMWKCPHLSIDSIRKGYLFYQKLAYKRVRGWTSGRNLPALNFVETPLSLDIKTVTALCDIYDIYFLKPDILLPSHKLIFKRCSRNLLVILSFFGPKVEEPCTNHINLDLIDSTPLYNKIT